ncbi:uncharacterized protein LY89DRAFT_315797 [Mollisia scopiformis]|uniref:Uncharacterized protein n=1 Tax=Mollisia scopiformis TaxID=149040 RepID=A0A132B9A6_MOLSC|nr:uncharacterized protein LY89DRAFT_315797 [Mollisia scopiformis]KUJ08951.1 hypothetical protein LY89DRAFT_315797 [Mollisia scopiformis]
MSRFSPDRVQTGPRSQSALTMAFQRFTTMLLHDRTAPIITAFASIVAFVLSLLALLSTSKQGGLIQYDLVMLNTSTIFQNAIKVETAGASGTSSASVAARAANVPYIPAPTAAPVLHGRDPLSLPSPSQVSSFFASIGSGLSSAVSPPQSTGTASTSSGTDSNGLLGDLESFFNALVGSATGAIGDEVVQVVNSIVADVTKALGVKDWYGLYMTGFCDGEYTSSDGMNTSSCTQYTDLHINSTNSTVQLGTTTLDFSALNIPAKLSASGGQIKAVLKTVLALQIIGIVSAGILIILAPLEILFSFFRRWLVHLVIGCLAALATACFAVIAFAATAIQVAVSSLVNDLGDGLGIEAYSGGNLLALVWISYILMEYAAVLWFIRWFIRWHAHRYVRREKGLGPSQRPLVRTAESRFIR